LEGIGLINVIVASGSRFGASLSAHGQRLAEACVTMRKPVENGLSLLSRPTVLLRYFPRLAAGYQDKPAVNELAMSITDNLTVAGAWLRAWCAKNGRSGV